MGHALAVNYASKFGEIGRFIIWHSLELFLMFKPTFFFLNKVGLVFFPGFPGYTAFEYILEVAPFNVSNLSISLH